MSHKKKGKMIPQEDNKNWIRRNLNEAQLRGCCSYKCLKCGKVFGSRKEVRSHLKDDHSEHELLSDYHEAV